MNRDNKVKIIESFLKVILEQDKDISKKLLILEKKLIKSNPPKYGHERTLIIVKISQA